MHKTKKIKNTIAVFLAGLMVIPLSEGLFQNDESMSVSAQSLNPVTTTAPIKEAYAGGEYVLFLHEDTSITGFGSNVNNVLGMPGGENSNTGELIQVSEATGFSHLKARRARAYGYRPLADNPNLFEWVEINTDIITPREKNVKDADWSGRAAPGVNHHDGYVMIDDTGQVWASGSDYSNGGRLGIGVGHPYNRYTYGNWRKVLSPKTRTIFVDGNDTTNFPGFKNENTGTNVVLNTPNFTIPADTDAWDIHVDYNVPSEYGLPDTDMTIEIIDSTGAVVKTDTNPYRVHGSAFNSEPYVPVEGLPTGDYKLRITTTNTGWDVRIVERDYFDNAKKSLYTWGASGRFTIIDDNNNFYTHTSGWGQVRPVSSSEFDAVTIDINNVVAGSTHFAGVDTNGQLWTWYATSPTKIVFPNVDNLPFYDTRKITKVSAGGGFTMAIAEVIASGVTEVWVFGNNSYGKLGLNPTPTDTNTPTRVERDGQPLTNIISVAAGDNHSVIVQNTPEGQLVWTAGHNAKGQLGGGMKLNVTEPQLVPGLKGIKRLAVQHTPEVVAVGNELVYSFGGPKSYPEITNLGRVNTALQDKVFDEWVQKQHIYWRQSIFSRPTGSSMLITSGDRKAYGFGYAGYAATSVNGTGFTPVKMDPEFDGQFGRTLGDLEFSNVRSIDAPGFAGNLVDENGMLWGWGPGYRSGVRSQANISPDPNSGEYRYTNYAHPVRLSDDTLAPSIFVKVASTYNGGYALTDTGKLWHIQNYLYPINSSYDINNVVIVDIIGGPYERFIALDNNGEIWYWNRGGTPVKIDKTNYNNENVIKIVAGKDNYLFITETGKVYGFGNNSYGKLGDGTTEHRDLPVRALNITNAVEVYAGDDFSAAVDTEGRVWAWGYTAYGSLGNNFSLSRGKISTAVGNDLPEMSIENELKTSYFSSTGNKTITFKGTIREKEQEDVNISVSILGVEKTANIQASSWALNIYDEVIPQKWELTWDVSEIPNEQTFQSLTKAVGEDTRGGIVEQFFAGAFVIDNETPIEPTWGDTCIMEETGPVCYEGQHFQKDGTNGADKPVRLYIHPVQKIGDNKAPVKVEISYRQKQAYGYPIEWSSWEEVKTKDDTGYYYEFFQGFQGETQVRTRAVDEAGNISPNNTEYRYVILANAGAEVDKAFVEPFSIENVLSNDITFTAKTPSGSSIQSYGIKRREQGDLEWLNLTDPRVSWDGSGETKFSDNIEGLFGNTIYEYSIDAENNIAVGAPKIASVITYPYIPTNFITQPTETQIDFKAVQDARNNGEVLYRLVIIENATGKIYTEDVISDNPDVDILFSVKDTETGFTLDNNSLTIKLLLKGTNGKFVEVVYNTEFKNSSLISTDQIQPEVFFGVENNQTQIIDDGTNSVNLTLFGTDNVTPSNDLEVQISKNGNDWYGQKTDGSWTLNYWSDYKTLYTNFILGTGIGDKAVYVKVRDQAGNVSQKRVVITVAEEATRDETLIVTDPNNGASSGSTITPVKSSFIELNLPHSGNVVGVQFSFDGVNWSPWETFTTDMIKQLRFPENEGEHAIFMRYKNEFGEITQVTPENDVIKYVVDKTKPTANVLTDNGTRVVKGSSIVLNVTPSDNASTTVDVSLATSGLGMAVGATTVADVYTMTTDTEYGVFISNLLPGFNHIKLDFKDNAGNIERKVVRVYSKQ